MTLIISVSSHTTNKGRGPTPSVHAWLENGDDSLQQHLASGSNLPNSNRYKISSYHGMAPSAILTSQVGNGGTAATPMGSLPGLSSSGTSGSPESIATSMGTRDIERRQRVLRPDWSQDGALIIDPQTVAASPLGCPFHSILGCRWEFDNGHESVWIDHSLSHFKRNGKEVEPPKTNKCCFCDKEILKSTGTESWKAKMNHIRQDHHMNGHRMATARPDFELARYLWGAKIIDDVTFRDWTGKQRSDSPPSSPDRDVRTISYIAESRKGGRSGRR